MHFSQVILDLSSEYHLHETNFNNETLKLYRRNVVKWMTEKLSMNKRASKQTLETFMKTLPFLPHVRIPLGVLLRTSGVSIVKIIVAVKMSGLLKYITMLNAF